MRKRNATGIMTGIPYLARELNDKNISICGISEHWLLPHNAYILERIDPYYNAHTVTCSNPSSLNGHLIGKGGVSILWHHSLDKFVETIETGSDRLVAIKLVFPEISIIVLQVYLPSVNHSLDIFKESIDKMLDFCAIHSQTCNLVIMGDFNARFDGNARSRDIYALNFALMHSLVPLTVSDACIGPNYTFLPYNDYNPSKIDHILVDEHLLSTVKDCRVIHDAPLNISRHLPVYAHIKLDFNMPNNVMSEEFLKQKYMWTKPNECNRYMSILKTNIESAVIDYSNIDEAYNTIISAISSAAEKTLSTRKFRPMLKPYWSCTLREMHKKLRLLFFTWRSHGKPRDGEIYKQYKTAKRDFRKRLRQASRQFEREEFERIDKLYELDQQGFWKVLNANKSINGKKKGCEIVFNGKSETTIDGILDGWSKYFSSLYTYSNEHSFDNSFKEHVESSVKSFIQSSSDHVENLNCDIFNEVTEQELTGIINELPNNKSGSIDNVTYEHLKYGVETLIKAITILFNKIIEKETLPLRFKTGLTVTLHKGKGKSFKDPKNYRAISLLPVVSKVFEKVILKRLDCLNIKLNNMQHGFQKGKSCKMVSFLLQESRDYCIERGSPLQACFLDAKSAFDMVWISGLIYKLNEMGVQGKLLRIINCSLRDSESKVFLNGHLSEAFKIMQGTRQGSICAPFYYTVFINELLNELQTSKSGFHIGDLSLSAPTQADVIVLLSTSRAGLQNLLDICRMYANKWRYTYNADKCASMVMNRKKLRVSECMKLIYGETNISEVSSYTHLGIIQSSNGNYPSNIDEVRQSMRGTYFSLKNSISGCDGVNPHIIARLFSACVLPRSLFACELWNCIKQSDIQKLESTFHLCLKNMQGLPHLTRSDMVTGMLGFTSIEAYIDLQKLLFLGTLCNLESRELTSKVFITRLMQAETKVTTSSLGFIPDVLRILSKYKLTSYVENFVESGSFPGKVTWKTFAKSRIMNHEQHEWRMRMESSNDFKQFRQINCALKMSNVWRVAQEKPELLSLMRFVAQLNCRVYSEQPVVYQKCSNDCTNELNHLMFHCNLNKEQSKMLTLFDCIERQFNSKLSTFLKVITPETFTKYVLGYVDNDLIDVVSADKYPDFMAVCAKFLASLF